MGDETFKPTPTQYENDKAAQGESQFVKTPDGSPDQPSSSPPAGDPQAQKAKTNEEPELNFRTRALEPERPGTYRTRAQRKADSESGDEEQHHDGGENV